MGGLKQTIKGKSIKGGDGGRSILGRGGRGGGVGSGNRDIEENNIGTDNTETLEGGKGGEVGLGFAGGGGEIGGSNNPSLLKDLFGFLH